MGHAEEAAPPDSPPEPALELGQPGQELARGGDRVHAGVRHRPVRHAAVDGDARPEDALLLEAELVLLRLADDGGGDAAAEGRRGEVLRAGHRVFLVHQRGDHEPPGDRDPGAAHGGRGHHRGRQPALHVRAAPPVELPVLDEPAPRRMAPGGGIALGHDVGVSLEAEGLARRRARRASR